MGASGARLGAARGRVTASSLVQYVDVRGGDGELLQISLREQLFLSELAHPAHVLNDLENGLHLRVQLVHDAQHLHTSERDAHGEEAGVHPGTGDIRPMGSG